MSTDRGIDKDVVCVYVCACVYIHITMEYYTPHIYTTMQYMWYTHINRYMMEYYSAIEKNEMLPFAAT